MSPLCEDFTSRSATPQDAGVRAWLHEPPQQEAFARMHHLLTRSFGCGLLNGPPHCGKSLLLRAFRAQVARTQATVCLLDGAGLDEESLLWELAAACGVGPAPGSTIRRLRQSVSDCLGGLLESGRQVALLLDHADAMPESALHAFARIVRSAEATGRITVVWCARMPLKSACREILQPLTELRIDLGLLTDEATEAYVLQSSRQPAGTFEPAAIAAIRRHAAGRLRRVDQLCRLAMMAAQAEDRTTVTRELIDAAVLELA